jgi:hypothetical protein
MTNNTSTQAPAPAGGDLFANIANPLASRNDLARAMRDLYEPLRAFRVPSGFHLGESAAHYSHRTAECEAFLRPLWGLAPLTAGGGTFDHWAEWRATLVAATDPAHPAFWGYLTGADQRAVEMASLATALLLAPGEVWEPLTPTQRHQLVAWLTTIETCKGMMNNWIFFRILVHVALQHLGQPIDAAQHSADLAAIDGLYLEEGGWYSDGPGPQRDYYIPMGMHYYGLLYSRFANAEDPERCAHFRQRAARFAASFQHWFTPAGDALPYGRSLTYRFALGAFWGALAFAGVEAEGLTRGQVKGIYLRHLRWWFQQPIFTPAGILSIGYRYPNLMVSEFYNAPGSPYWSTKAFIPLALPAEDPFWQVAEEPLPARPAVVVQAPAGLILQHDDARHHLVALASGQFAGFMQVPSSNKYAKCAYSTAFGFSALGAEGGPGGSGQDSTLSLSDDESHYRSRETCTSVVVRGQTLASRWKPWADVTVETWLAPAGVGHVRIHHVTTPRELTACDAGFSLPTLESEKADGTADTSRLASSAGISAVRDLIGGGKTEYFAIRSNLNVLHALARMPAITRVLPPGDHWLAEAVVGIPDATAGAEATAFLKGLTWEAKAGAVPVIRQGDQVILAAEPIPAGGTLMGVR